MLHYDSNNDDAPKPAHSADSRAVQHAPNSKEALAPLFSLRHARLELGALRRGLATEVAS